MARALSTYSLLSMAEVCRACTGTSTEPTGDVLDDVMDVAERVSDELERALGRHLVTRGAITEYHTIDPGNPSVIYLGQFPNVVITTAKEGYWYEGAWVAVETLVVGEDYVLDAARGKLTRISTGSQVEWSDGFEEIQVVYAAGYANTAAVPQRIKRVAAALASRMYATMRRGQPDAQSVTDGMGSVTRFAPAELLSMERAALANEVRYHFTGRAA